MKALALGVVAALVGLEASAQPIFQDPQRRAYVVPFARAATDCLGRELLTEKNAAEAVRAGQIRDALGGPFRRCANEVNEMIAAHDRAYYPGTGEAFFQGPYLQDLPRAILRRVQPELDRREQEAAQAAAEAARKASEAAEQQKANDARAAALWAENDRKQAASANHLEPLAPEARRQPADSEGKAKKEEPWVGTWFGLLLR